MEGNQVSAKELKEAMAADFDRLAEEVAATMNAAKDGLGLPVPQRLMGYVLET